MNRRWWLLPMGVALSTAACGAAPKRSADDLLEASLHAYASAMRFGQIDDAMAFLSPEQQAKHPMSSTELERYHQVRIVGYQERGLQRVDAGHVRQVVTLEV